MNGSPTSTGLALQLGNLDMVMLPQKALWLPEPGWLLVADLHLGKAAHFRRNGLAVPPQAGSGDLSLLGQLLLQLPVQALIFLGDLFHSEYNQAWESFCAWREEFPLPMWLVEGNHDILPPVHYHRAGLELMTECRHREWCFTHEPVLSARGSGFFAAGHVHPGIRLQGSGRQSLRLPCFFWSDNQLLLPAFGSFTGLALVRPLRNDLVFAVTEDRVLQLK